MEYHLDYTDLRDSLNPTADCTVQTTKTILILEQNFSIRQKFDAPINNLLTSTAFPL